MHPDTLLINANKQPTIILISNASDNISITNTSASIRNLLSISEIIHAVDNLLALPQSARGNISGARSWHRGRGHRSPTVAVPRAANTVAVFRWGINAFFPFRQRNHQLSVSVTQTGRTNTRPCRTAHRKAGLGPVYSLGERGLLSTQRSCSKARGWAQASHMQPFMKHMVGKKPSHEHAGFSKL